MEQATTNYLTLVNDSIDEAGDDLASFAVDGSDFATNTDPMMNRFKKWVKRAWRDIQQESLDWEWMSEQAVVNITPGIMFYSPHIIDWDISAINPLTLYDVDGTANITGLSASGLHDLTGIYTHLENFGYINVQYPDYSFSNQHTLDFGLKAGGEYFTTPGNGLDAILFTPALRQTWAAGEPNASVPVLLGPYATTLVVPTAGTVIDGLRIVTFDVGDLATPVSNTLYNITGTARPSTGAATNAVFELTVGQDLSDFFSDYNLAVQFPDDDIVCVYLVSGSTLYGGIVRACLHNANDELGLLYTIGFHPSSYTWAWDIVIGSGTIAEFGGFSGIAGDTVVSGKLAFSGAFTGQTVEADFIATLTSDVSVTDGVTLSVTTDVDGADVGVYNHFQDIAGFAAVDVPDYNDIMYADNTETSGLSVEVLDSGDLQTMAIIAVEDGTDETFQYIHSWKSFDWSEELGDDDFVEKVREVNQSTFRIIYHDDPIIAGESPLQFIPWESFQNRFDFASCVPSTPRIVTEDNTGRWRFYPPPNRPYTVLFDYVREPQNLSLWSSVPRGLPEEYTDLIMWRAVAYYGEYDEQPSVAFRAWKNYKTLLMKFEMQTRPKFHFKSAYPWGSATFGR